MDKDRLRVALGYEAALVPGGGITRYVQQLAALLAPHPEIARLGLLNGAGFHEGPLVLEPPAANAIASQEFRPGPTLWLKQKLRGAVMRTRFGASLVEGRYERRTANLVKPEVFDLYHETNYIARPVRIPTVVSIHDLSVFDVPEYHPAPRVRALTRLIPRSMARADGIVTLSALSARAIARRFPAEVHKVRVVPIGIDSHFKPMSPAETAEVRAVHGLAHRGFLLSVGTMEPRKNLAGVIDALTSLPEADVRACPLVIAGGAGWANDGIRQRIEEATARGLVRHIGAVDEPTLAALYASARGLVFLSLYEGQGLPAQEAAASGTAVLTSTGSAMADTLGAAALLANPRDVREMASGLMQLISDQSRIAQAEAAAQRFQADFSWDTCMAQTLVAYRVAMQSFAKQRQADRVKG